MALHELEMDNREGDETMWEVCIPTTFPVPFLFSASEFSDCEWHPLEFNDIC